MSAADTAQTGLWGLTWGLESHMHHVEPYIGLHGPVWELVYAIYTIYTSFILLWSLMWFDQFSIPVSIVHVMCKSTFQLSYTSITRPHSPHVHGVHGINYMHMVQVKSNQWSLVNGGFCLAVILGRLLMISYE